MKNIDHGQLQMQNIDSTQLQMQNADHGQQTIYAEYRPWRIRDCSSKRKEVLILNQMHLIILFQPGFRFCMILRVLKLLYLEAPPQLLFEVSC